MAGISLLQPPAVTILQQIEELKTWNKQQQSKINSVNTSTYKIENIGNNVNLTKEESIKSVGSKIKSSFLQHNFDKIHIKGTNQHFNIITENNIEPNYSQNSQTNHNEIKPKFPFLKKGEGIARFRLGPKKNTKYYRNTNNQTLKLSNSIKQSNDANIPNEENQENLVEQKVKISENIPRLDPPDVRLDLKNCKTIFESKNVEKKCKKAIASNQLELYQSNSFIDSSAASILAFEIMEQCVLDSSFCSTSSCIDKFMKNAIISTPVKPSLKNCQFSGSSTHSNLLFSVPRTERQQEMLVSDTENKILQAPISINSESIHYLDYKSKNDEPNANNFEQSLHVVENLDYKSFVEYFPSVNSYGEKEASACKSFYCREEWKEDDNSVCSSDCNSRYSSLDDCVMPISPLPKSYFLENDQQSNRETSKNTENCRNRPTEKSEEVKINSCSTSYLGCLDDKKGHKNIYPRVVLEKMKVLEQEIEIFYAGNNKIEALRKGLVKMHKQFEKEKERLLKEIEEKKQNALQQLDEKRKQLTTDKFVFEKYSKSLTKSPTKEETKQIKALKEQLCEMKQELNKKESHWGSAQARVRNEVKLIKEENITLKREIEMLQKQCKHLEFLTKKSKVKPFNNTKCIPASDKHISRIAVRYDETSKKVQNEDCFNNTNKEKLLVIDDVDRKSVDFVNIMSRESKAEQSVVAYEKTNLKTSDILQKQSMTNDCLAILNHTAIAESLDQVTDKLQENSQQDSNQKLVDHTGNVHIVHPDGKNEIRYKNGNLKKIDPSTGNQKLIYFNGDVKELTGDGTVRYYFSENHVWQTTLPNGLEIFDIPNQHVERRHKNGMVEFLYPSGRKKIIYPDNSEEIYFTNGNVLKKDVDKKRKVLYLPNGGKEIQTDKYIHREYPDGTVRIVYPDGTMETTYPNGRLQLKDKHGNLVNESLQLSHVNLQ